MSAYLNKLLEISECISTTPNNSRAGFKLLEQKFNLPGAEVSTLEKILSIKNGFYAFESALHFLGTGSDRPDIDIEAWNSPDLWIKNYATIKPDGLCFAEDLFGNQFYIASSGIYNFDCETGDKEKLARNFREWCKLILDDYDYLTGYTLAHEWQKKNGPLEPGKRLMAKVPFALEGDFDVDNLQIVNAVDLMLTRANFAIQLASIPDGTKIKINIQ